MLIHKSEKSHAYSEHTRSAEKYLYHFFRAVFLGCDAVFSHIFFNFAVHVKYCIGHIKIHFRHCAVIHLARFQHHHSDGKLISRIRLAVHNKSVKQRKFGGGPQICRYYHTHMTECYSLLALFVEIILYRVVRYIKRYHVHRIHTLVHYIRRHGIHGVGISEAFSVSSHFKTPFPRILSEVFLNTLIILINAKRIISHFRPKHNTFFNKL